MRNVPKEFLILVAVLLASLAGGCAPPETERRAIAAFWFEPVSYSSPVLNGPLTPTDLTIIERIARAEIDSAFEEFNITVLDRVDNARYSVRVVQELLDRRMEREMSVAGESRVFNEYGGSGSVNFNYISGAAIVYAPPAATRSEIVDAIGRGIGRAAVHELTHQLLPKAPIDETNNQHSYEYGAGSRAEQYFGTLHWDFAGPLLAKRLGRR